MKALTVRQPWVYAILHGKPIENRFWGTAYRGPLAIHAAAGVGTKAEYAYAVERVAELLGVTEETVDAGAQSYRQVVTVVRLADVCSLARYHPYSPALPCDCGPWAMPQQRHFRLADGQPLSDPVSAKGALNLWVLPPEVEAAVLVQLRTGVTR